MSAMGRIGGTPLRHYRHHFPVPSGRGAAPAVLPTRSLAEANRRDALRVPRSSPIRRRFSARH